jgi:glycosyltransferase involved in cell wall biosynthesis
MTFENPLVLKDDPKQKERYNQAKKMLDGKIAHVEIPVPFGNSRMIMNSSVLRGIRFFLMIIVGIIETISFLNREKIEVIHCRSSYPTIIGVVAKFFSSCRVLYDNRGIPGEEMKGRKFDPQSFVYNAVEETLLKYSDSIVVVSTPFKDYLLENYPDLDLKEKIKVIENGFSPDRIKYSDSQRKIRREEEGLSDRIVMTYSGTLSKWQMFEEICDLFILFKKLEPKALFLVLSPDATEVEKIIWSKKISSEDFRIFNITNNQLGDYLILGDFGVLFRLPLLINKVAAPIKFAEYLAAGLPVLLTPGIGDTEKMCMDGEYGIVIESSEKNLEGTLHKMITLVRQPGINTKCSSYAISRLSVDSAALKYLNIYFS